MAFCCCRGRTWSMLPRRPLTFIISFLLPINHSQLFFTLFQSVSWVQQCPPKSKVLKLLFCPFISATWHTALINAPTFIGILVQLTPGHPSYNCTVSMFYLPPMTGPCGQLGGGWLSSKSHLSICFLGPLLAPNLTGWVLQGKILSWMLACRTYLRKYSWDHHHKREEKKSGFAVIQCQHQLGLPMGSPGTGTAL